MAQIQVIGFVDADLQIKQSRNETAYVCFHLKEHLGKGRWQTYQVWAWSTVLDRLQRYKIKEGSLIMVSGSLELVDCTVNHGRVKTKVLKLYCTDFETIPYRKSEHRNAENESVVPELPTIPEVLDGDRVQLPE